MKNIFEIMKEFGIEMPEDKQKGFEKALLENYKTVTDYENQTEKLAQAGETIKANDTAMKDLQAKLDELKDVDVSGLNKRISELETEKKTIASEYEGRMAERDFSDMLKDCIAKANGRNAKAIIGCLDLEALKASKNQRGDIEEALKNLADSEDGGMLFGEERTEVTGAGNPIGTVTKKASSNEMDAEMRAAMGLLPVKKEE